jgi:hypothetical protein
MEEIEMAALEHRLPDTPPCIIVLYDVRDFEAREVLRCARRVWQDRSEVETLDRNSHVLIVRPGGARRLAT